MFKTSPRQQYRDCVIGLGMSAYSNLFINHASCIHSLSCLPFFLYHHYNMPLCLNSQDLYTTRYWKGASHSSPCVLPLASLRSEEVISVWGYLLLWSSWKWWKWCKTHAYQVSPLQLASLRSEEVIWKKSAWGYLLLWSLWKRCNTHAHQVSPPCVQVWGVKKWF